MTDRQGAGGGGAATANNRRRDGRWRCGENSRCNGGTEIVLPLLSSGGFRLVDSRGMVAASMDFFWENTVPSRSSTPSVPRSDFVVRMVVRNYSMCGVTVGATVYANGQTMAYVGSASSSEVGLEAAPTSVLTRHYTVTGVPDSATVTIRTGDTPRDICLP